MLTIGERIGRGGKLRKICFVIAYLHLLSSVLDIGFHLLTEAIVTNGFQCDVDYTTFNSIPWAIIEPIFLVLNLGTHGFYPFPGVFQRHYNIYVEQTRIATEQKCYPGILHVYMVDVLNFLINLVWLKIVVAYISALHKKNPDPMSIFFNLSIVKIIMQVMYFGYQPYFHNVFAAETYWLLKIADIFVAIIFLAFVKNYTNLLIAEKKEANVEKPPPYIECLINSNAYTLPGTNGNTVYGIVHEVNKTDQKTPPEEENKETENNGINLYALVK